jgi:pilus assembly protein Flp/PilA
MRRFIWRLLRDEDGPTAVEYAVMLALVVMACIAAIGTMGVNTNTLFTTVTNSGAAYGF